MIRQYLTVYWGYWVDSVSFSNTLVWLSIMLNSSCGDGMRPVSNFDQTGISFRLISNAPEATS